MNEPESIGIRHPSGMGGLFIFFAITFMIATILWKGMPYAGESSAVGQTACPFYSIGLYFWMTLSGGSVIGWWVFSTGGWHMDRNGIVEKQLWRRSFDWRDIRGFEIEQYQEPLFYKLSFRDSDGKLRTIHTDRFGADGSVSFAQFIQFLRAHTADRDVTIHPPKAYEVHESIEISWY